jgi:hypothetical protein
MQSREHFANIAHLLKFSTAMLETNSIHARIADLQSRIESLRGYL